MRAGDGFGGAHTAQQQIHARRHCKFLAGAEEGLLRDPLGVQQGAIHVEDDGFEVLQNGDPHARDT